MGMIWTRLPFLELAEKIPNDEGVIKAIELAPEGIVTAVYPKQGNTEALKLNMLQEHERKADAALAKQTGKVIRWEALTS